MLTLKGHTFFFLIGLTVSLFLVSCPANSGHSETLGQRTLIDQTGHTVHVPQKIDRVVTALYPIATQLVFLLRSQDRLVGIAGNDVNAVLKRIYPPITTIPQPTTSAHSEVAIEEIIRLHPDVVFTHHGKRMEKLNALGIPTFCLSVESPEALIKGIQLMGRLLGQESRAEEVVTYYKSKLSWIRQQTRDITRKKQVYFAGPTMLSTSGGDRYQHFLIQAAGGVNVAKANRGGWSGITIEQLISWNPEVIIVARYGAARPDSFVKDLRFREIQAVKKGQVLQVPSFIFSWDVPTPESLLGIMWLANTLYPNRVTFDLNNEIKSFYSKMYDYTPSQAEIDSILAYESNE